MTNSDVYFNKNNDEDKARNVEARQRLSDGWINQSNSKVRDHNTGWNCRDEDIGEKAGDYCRGRWIEWTRTQEE